MAYKVVMLDDYRAARSAGGPGRPPKYTVEVKSVSFRVGVALLKKGREKAQANHVNMTELFAYHYLSFVTRPIEETRALLSRYRATYGPIEVAEAHYAAANARCG